MGPCKSGSTSGYSSSLMEGTDSEDEQVPRHKKMKIGKGDDDYKLRRNRNNVAVRKSRDKSRRKAKDTMEKVNRLRSENEALEQKVQILSKELGVLKDLFLAHAGTVAEGNCNVVTRNSIQNDHKYFKEEKEK